MWLRSSSRAEKVSAGDENQKRQIALSVESDKACAGPQGLHNPVLTHLTFNMSEELGWIRLRLRGNGQSTVYFNIHEDFERSRYSLSCPIVFAAALTVEFLSNWHSAKTTFWLPAGWTFRHRLQTYAQDGAQHA
jgi:hypothetical protein